jgi:hypothetical protein
MNHGERQATDFAAFLVRDQDREVTLPQIRPLVQYSSRDRVGGIHCFNVIMQFSAALIHARLGVDQVEMIERHLTLQPLSGITTPARRRIAASFAGKRLRRIILTRQEHLDLRGVRLMVPGTNRRQPETAKSLHCEVDDLWNPHPYIRFIAAQKKRRPAAFSYPLN